MREVPFPHKLLKVPHHLVGDPRDNDVVHYQPDTPFGVSVDTSIPIPPDLIERIKQVMSWEALPNIEMNERTATIPLNGELDDLGHGPMSSVRVKGVGVHGGDNLCVPPFTGTPYFQFHHPIDGSPILRTDPRFSPNGELYVDLDTVDPIGGAYVSTAQHEAELYQRVRDLGIQTVVPLGYGSYTDRPAFGQQTGTLIYAMPKGDFVRSSDLYFERDNRTLKPAPQMKRALESAGEDPDDASAQWKLLSQVEVTRGATLRTLHDGGLYGFQLHPGNLSIDLQNRDRYLLHDMEEGRSLGDVPEFADVFLMANDLTTTLNGMLRSIVRLLARRPKSFKLPEKMNALENPLASQLAGYFKVEATELPRSLLKYAHFLLEEAIRISRNPNCEQVFDSEIAMSDQLNFTKMRSQLITILLSGSSKERFPGSKNAEAYKLMGTHYDHISHHIEKMLRIAFMTDQQTRAGYFRLLEQLVDPRQHQQVTMALSNMPHFPKPIRTS